MSWRLALYCVLALLAAGAAGAVRAELVELREAEVLIEPYRSAPDRVPAADADWRPISLAQQVKNPSGGLVRVWFRIPIDRFRIPIDNPQPGERHWTVMFPRLLSGGEVFLDGAPIGSVEGDSPQVHTNWLRPHYFLLPEFGAGPHVLTVAVASRQPNIGIAPPILGPSDEVAERYEQRLLLEYGIVFVTIWLMGAGSLLVMAVWYQRRQEPLAGVFSLLMVALALRSVNFVMPVMPIEHWPYWRAAFYLGTGYGIVLLCIVIIRLGGLRQVWLERVALAYAGIGAVGVVIEGPAFLRWETLWLTGFPPLLLYTLLIVGRVAWQKRTWEVIALTGILSAGVLVMMHDYSVKAGLIAFSGVYLGHVVAPFVTLALGGVFIQRFVAALRSAEISNLELELRVRAREEELRRSFEDTRRLTRIQAATEERQRIMQDMHDGFGSQLITSLAMVEHGRADQAELALVLRQCIDDLRLTIDALTPDEDAEHADLLRALAMLRSRLDVRLQTAGIALRWNIRTRGYSILVLPRTALGMLRIVQEAITNALKHAAATRIEVEVADDAGELEIGIADNGHGFDPAEASQGRGLTGIRKRAQELGARFDLTSSNGGTRMTLRFRQ